MRSNRSIHSAPRAAFALLLAAAALLSGCSSNKLLQPMPKPLSRVSLSLHVDTLSVFEQRQFVATPFDTLGVATGGVVIGWQSSDPAVCTIDYTGFATAVGEGSALIIASASGKSDTAHVYVRSGVLGWYTQVSATGQNLNAVYFLADGHTGFAVGAAGTMVTTTNAGADWAPHTSGTGLDLASVWFSDATTGWAVGAAGTLVKTVNTGATWAQQANLPTTANLQCVRFVDARHGWIVGGAGGVSGGFVARTRDAGLTWTTQPLGGGVLYGVAMVDTLTGWVAGAGGVVYGTRDGGANWTLVQPSMTAQTLRGVARVSSALAWAVGSQGTILSTAATVDSFAWQPPASLGAYQLNAIQMLSATTGWIVGGNPSGLIFKASANPAGGVTWTSQPVGSAEALNGVYFADGLRGWAVGAGGRIVHTSTAGVP
jgi:photosystem II stability/assembly factor-like uncharacterized protein